MTDAPHQPVYTVKLQAQRLEYVLNALAQRPYIEVAALLDDIRGQLAAQAEAPEGGAQLKAV
jgi:hypothetical protein